MIGFLPLHINYFRKWIKKIIAACDCYFIFHRILTTILFTITACVLYRGDVVIVRSPEDPKCFLCKRVAAMVGKLLVKFSIYW